MLPAKVWTTVLRGISAITMQVVLTWKQPTLVIVTQASLVMDIIATVSVIYFKFENDFIIVNNLLLHLPK